jgi:hypothetical protein
MKRIKTEAYESKQLDDGVDDAGVPVADAAERRLTMECNIQPMCQPNGGCDRDSPSISVPGSRRYIHQLQVVKPALCRHSGLPYAEQLRYSAMKEITRAPLSEFARVHDELENDWLCFMMSSSCNHSLEDTFLVSWLGLTPQTQSSH